MNSGVSVAIDPSQFPENVRRDFLASLRTRRVNHKFHYDSLKQTQKWLALHEAHSPARYDKNCLTTYDAAFIATAKKIKSKSVHVIGLGCGGGQKDVQLLKQLQSRGKKNSYAPGDVSVAMVLVAREAALKILPPEKCFPFVCDLATTKNLSALLSETCPPRAARLVTFFGMIPNFEPRQILPKLVELLRPNDFMLFSANLAPGKNYAVGMEKILPQYDNQLTRDWLLTFLFDLGIDPRDGELRFAIETGSLGLQRVVTRFHFRRARQIEVGSEKFSFASGESIQLFFSYRYTPERVCKILARFGLAVSEQWITKSEEEGVFLCQRK